MSIPDAEGVRALFRNLREATDAKAWPIVDQPLYELILSLAISEGLTQRQKERLPSLQRQALSLQRLSEHDRGVELDALETQLIQTITTMQSARPRNVLSPRIRHENDARQSPDVPSAAGPVGAAAAAAGDGNTTEARRSESLSRDSRDSRAESDANRRRSTSRPLVPHRSPSAEEIVEWFNDGSPAPSDSDNLRARESARSPSAPSPRPGSRKRTRDSPNEDEDSNAEDSNIKKRTSARADKGKGKPVEKDSRANSSPQARREAMQTSRSMDAEEGAARPETETQAIALALEPPRQETPDSQPDVADEFFDAQEDPNEQDASVASSQSAVEVGGSERALDSSDEEEDENETILRSKRTRGPSAEDGDRDNLLGEGPSRTAKGKAKPIEEDANPAEPEPETESETEAEAEPEPSTEPETQVNQPRPDVDREPAGEPTHPTEHLSPPVNAGEVESAVGEAQPLRNRIVKTKHSDLREEIAKHIRAFRPLSKVSKSDLIIPSMKFPPTERRDEGLLASWDPVWMTLRTLILLSPFHPTIRLQLLRYAHNKPQLTPTDQQEWMRDTWRLEKIIQGRKKSGQIELLIQFGDDIVEPGESNYQIGVKTTFKTDALRDNLLAILNRPDTLVAGNPRGVLMPGTQDLESITRTVRLSLGRIEPGQDPTQLILDDHEYISAKAELPGGQFTINLLFRGDNVDVCIERFWTAEHVAVADVQVVVELNSQRGEAGAAIPPYVFAARFINGATADSGNTFNWRRSEILGRNYLGIVDQEVFLEFTLRVYTRALHLWNSKKGIKLLLKSKAKQKEQHDISDLVQWQETPLADWARFLDEGDRQEQGENEPVNRGGPSTRDY